MFIPVNYRKIIWKVALWLTESASLIQKFHVNHRCLRDLIIIMFGEIFEGMRLIRNITPRSVIMMIVHRDMKQIMKLKFHVSIVALPLLSRLCFIVSDCRSTMYQSEIFSFSIFSCKVWYWRVVGDLIFAKMRLYYKHSLTITTLT